MIRYNDTHPLLTLVHSTTSHRTHRTRVRCRYVALACDMVVETLLENSVRPSVAFNNTSVHVFPKDRLASVDPTTWANADEPSHGVGSEAVLS